MFYHASLNDLGRTVSLNKGGYYEATENARPQLKTICGNYIGYKHSDTPQLCASKSPEAATLAKAQHADQQGLTSTKSPTTIYIYSLSDDPDEDLSNEPSGDFSLLEEVRYNSPSETPIKATHYQTVELPAKILTDIKRIYALQGPHTHEKWGVAVKSGIKHCLDTGEYPDDIASFGEVKTPPTREEIEDMDVPAQLV
jgi:hypothetical protein